jgi:hypothetical protein
MACCKITKTGCQDRSLFVQFPFLDVQIGGSSRLLARRAAGPGSSAEWGLDTAALTGVAELGGIS